MTPLLKKSTTDRAIERAKAKLERLDERIGMLMSQRVDVEELLASLYRRREVWRGKFT